MASRPKAGRKGLGQFFTSKETARYMAGLFDIPSHGVIRVLDPGAGSGILSAALIERLERQAVPDLKVDLTCFEANRDVLPLLRANLDLVRADSRLALSVRVIDANYVLSQSNDFSKEPSASPGPAKYDMVIANPPYLKLSKDAPEAVSMRSVCHGPPNMYFLFATMSLFNLRDEGEMVYLMPHSWTSGAYFSSFRDYVLSRGRLTDVHLFESGDKVFDKEGVLQETMIVKMRKTPTTPRAIKVSSSVGPSDLGQKKSLSVPYGVVVSGKDNYVYLARTREEIDVVKTVASIGKPLPSIGLRMKTGLTVDSRSSESLGNSIVDHAVPLFHAQHIKDGQVVFPIGLENEYIIGGSKGTLQLNRNYLFVKRFASKEEPRRLRCGVYLARLFPGHDKISTENKINFIDTMDGSGMSEELVHGLYVILNSSLYDAYYRILNGTTQVNATEMNSVPVPARHDIELLGREMMGANDYSTGFCDQLLGELLGGLAGWRKARAPIPRSARRGEVCRRLASD
jgi:adenine-specific DNA-methyltransferase